MLFLCTFQKCYWFALVANRGCKWCDAAACYTNGKKKKIKEDRKCYKCWTPDFSVITNNLKELRVFLGKGRTLVIWLFNELREAKNEKTGCLLPCHAHLCSCFSCLVVEQGMRSLCYRCLMHVISCCLKWKFPLFLSVFQLPSTGNSHDLYPSIRFEVWLLLQEKIAIK